MKRPKIPDKAHDGALLALFSISLFIIIIFGSFNMMIFNKEFYQNEYRRNGAYLELSDDKYVGQEMTENITTNVMRYFRNSEDLKYFTDNEKSHMEDVKHLIRTMQAIYYSAAALSIILFFYCYRVFREDKHAFIRMLSKVLLYSSIASIIFLVGLFLLSVFAFDFMFTGFHMLFFPQGNWMFDNSTLLITLFPQDFFFDITLRIFIYAIFQALIFFGMGYWMHKQMRLFEGHRR